MNDKPTLTRAERRRLQRERRNSPAVKARRLAALRRNQLMAADRLANMKANPFDPAWKVQP